MTKQFVDLGAGWFLFEDEGNRCSVICDSRDGNPDRFFGPVAWRGAPGPLSGKAILEAHSVVRGSWQQTGPGEWAWYSEDGQEYVEPPPSWPRTIMIKAGNEYPSFQKIAGQIYAAPDDLVAALRAITMCLPAQTLIRATRAARMAFSTYMHAVFEVTQH